MSTRQRILKFLDKQGFYVILGLCLLVIIVTASLSQSPKKDAQKPAAQNTNIIADEVRKAAYAGENMVLEDATKQTEQKQTEQKAKSQKLSLARPAGGDVIMEFAMDKLLFNSTLKQWTTHSGIDIAADEGSPVKAAKGGTVESVEDDALMGTTVVISHEGDVKTVYSGLQKEAGVAKGDKVSAEQEIGKVGKTAISEFDMEPHLHFEVIIGGAKKNPMDYLSGIKVKQQ